jgi:hypothetical protein
MPGSRPRTRAAPPSELDRFLADFTPGVRALALRAREMIRQIRPDVVEKVWPGWKVVGYGTGPTMKEMVLGVAPLKERLRIGFTDGVAPPDPAGLLEGEGAGHRALKVATPEALEAPAVVALLREAFARAALPPDERERTDPAHAATMSDEAVRAKTGRGWEEWFALLDADGARERSHREIAELAARHGAEPWWRQAVAVSYERARGLREKHQTSSGYQVGASKTIAAPLARVYEAWTDARVLRRWLPGAKFTVRKATAEKSMRITWEDGSNVEVLFYAKGAAKSQVTVDHRKLPDADTVERMRGFWRERLVRLQELLEQ